MRKSIVGGLVTLGAVLMMGALIVPQADKVCLDNSFCKNFLFMSNTGNVALQASAGKVDLLSPAGARIGSTVSTPILSENTGSCSMADAGTCVITDPNLTSTSTILCGENGVTGSSYTGSVYDAGFYTVTASPNNSGTWHCLRTN
jgi:hypothetical protein